MKNISICVGSSCHLKGSYKIIELAKDYIANHNIGDKVNLGAAFCLGRCTDGVTIKIDDEIICGVNENNFQQIFDEKLSVRETEKLVKKIQQEKNQKDTEKNKKIDPKLEAICHDLEEKMKGILGTKVAINQKDNKKGKIEIEYYSMDELDRIMDLFRTIEK